MFPYYHKEKPYLVYSGPIKAYNIMKFVEKHADVGIELPLLPHIPEYLHERYYKLEYEK